MNKQEKIAKLFNELELGEQSETLKQMKSLLSQNIQSKQEDLKQQIQYLDSKIQEA